MWGSYRTDAVGAAFVHQWWRTVFSHHLFFFVQKGTSILNCNLWLLKQVLENLADKYFWLIFFSSPSCCFKRKSWQHYVQVRDTQTFWGQLSFPHPKISDGIKFLGNVKPSYTRMPQVSGHCPYIPRDKAVPTWLDEDLALNIFSFYILFDSLQFLNVLLIPS